MVLIVHAIAYLQYDMVVREPIFNKMILHKIGPRFSKQELAMQSLRERFPNMDPNDISMLINALNRQRQDDPNEDDTSAVSYTHLDVYKRQTACYLSFLPR